MEQNTAAQVKQNDHAPNSNKIPQLPMEWTKVKRKRPLSKGSVSLPSATFQSNNGSIVAADDHATNTQGKKFASSTDDNDNYFECCNGTICWDQINHQVLRKMSGKSVKSSMSSSTSISSLPTWNNRKMIMKGKAIFCLHQIDCKWFQGHFFPFNTFSKSPFSSHKQHKRLKPLGLLAKQNMNIEDCLNCCDGGYKELDILFTSYDPNHYQSNKQNKTFQIKDLVCFGGDMMNIQSRDILFDSDRNNTNLNENDVDKEQQKQQKQQKLEHLSGYHSTTHLKDTNHDFQNKHASEISGKHFDLEYNAERIITGKKIIPYLQNYFQPIVNHLIHSQALTRNEIVNKTDLNLLDLLPECAIVVGHMELTVSKESMKHNIYGSDIYDWIYNSWRDNNDEHKMGDNNQQPSLLDSDDWME